MRTSVLSRSVIAVASLAISSVALAAVPATAATPAGITRDVVLTAAQGFYANEGAQHSPPDNVIESFERLVALTCDFDAAAGQNELAMPTFKPFVNGNADGILITAELYEPTLEDGTPWRYCTFAALATTDATFSLNGSIALSIAGRDPEARQTAATVVAAPTAALSGNVFVTEPINVDNWYENVSASVATSGNATGTVNMTTSEKVTTPKSSAAKKVAKKAYAKKLKAAKRAYAKALKKAKSKTKKTAAKKAYAKKKAAAKKAYNKAIVTTKTVQKVTPVIQNRPFNVNVSVDTRYAD